MFSASGTNFGCYLQCFLPLEQISVATCMFCISSKFCVLFANLSASGTNSKCYLQCSTRLEHILGVICNVLCSWRFLWVPFAFLPPLGPSLYVICNVFCFWSQCGMLFAMFTGLPEPISVYWVAGGPRRTKKYRRRTGQKNSTGQKIRGIGAGRRRIVF